MDDFFEGFKNLIEMTSDLNNKGKFQEINKGLKTCGNKMISAVKFIDFFVHDILDYTLLNKKDKNFAKDLNLFNIQVAVEEIVNILEDKAALKNIRV
jgi:hypothetical protein